MQNGNEKYVQNIQIVFLQGVHYYNPQEYLAVMSQNTSLLNFVNPAHVQIINHRDKSAKILKCCLRDAQCLYVREMREGRHIYYWIDQTFSSNYQEERNKVFMITLNCQQKSNRFSNRSIITINMYRYSSIPERLTLFQELVQMGNDSFIFSPNYCKFSQYNELTYPSTLFFHSVSYKKPTIALMLNQTNLRETPFYVGAIQQTAKVKSISKIIGHPSSIFLIFLVNQQGLINDKIKEVILTHQNPQRVSKQDFKASKQDILKGTLFNMLNEQNILNPNLIQFLADNIVNEQFTRDFISLVQLYYKIFLKEDLSQDQIQCAIYNYFYYGQQKIQKLAFSFTTLLTLIQFKHNLYCNSLIQEILKNIPQMKPLQELTLQDLYLYNNIEFTFIGLDLNDKIVRFFNYTTTPKLPICAILSLVQFLPVPYKSILWCEEWGRYKINYGSQATQVDITNHEIVDSRFLLQCPLDLVEDPYLRQCYMSSFDQNETIHAVSSARKKVEELEEIEQLKTLLKSIKANAIESIPKLRLIWKILTTRNKIDLDLNNLQSFHQIPLLSRVIRLDETFKAYLENLNRQTNRKRIFKHIVCTTHRFYLQLNALSKNISDVKAIIKKLTEIKGNSVTKQNSQYKLNEIYQELSACPLRSYEAYLYILNQIQTIAKTQKNGKLQCINQAFSITQSLNLHHKFINYTLINKQIKQLITLMKSKHQSQFIAFQLPKQQLFSLLAEISKEEEAFRQLFFHTEKEIILQKYERLMYRISRSLFNIMREVNKCQQIRKLYYELYQITPFIFTIEQVNIFHLIQTSNIKSFFRNFSQNKKIHLILNGQPGTLLQLSHQLIITRRHFQNGNQSAIKYITATNHHSIAAILLAIGVGDEALMEQMAGIQSLVRTNAASINEDEFDLVELLLNNPHNQDDHTEEHQDLYLKIALKYKEAFKLLIRLQNQYDTSVYHLYQLIKHYDQQNDSQSTQWKEKEIMMFLQEEINAQSELVKKAELIIQNKDMIGDKLKTNKIGIRFIIRFLYRNIEKETNWFNIHKSKYKTLQTYKKYLKLLLNKYNIDENITLSAFNKINSSQIEIGFVLANYHQNKYQLFNSKQKGYVKLIDLILASLSVPLDFSPKLINIKRMSNQQKISLAINKSNHKFAQQYSGQPYWSNFGNNSAPFNILQAHSQDQAILYCSFQFIPQNTERPEENSLPKMKPSLSEQKYNLRAIDLLGMWWAKNKKLTPELKEILFGSIFNSPFLYYYYIVQNSSYQALLFNRQKRSLVDLSCGSTDLYKKGKIIGKTICGIQGSLILRAKRREDSNYLDIQLIRISKFLQIKIQKLNLYLKQGQVCKLKNEPQIPLVLYHLTNKTLHQYKTNWAVNDEIQYYQLKVGQQDIRLGPVDCELKPKLQMNLRSFPLITFHSCKSFKEIVQQGICQKCNNEQNKMIRGNMNLFLLGRESYLSEYNDLKNKVIEEVRQSLTLKTIKDKQKEKKNNYLCFLCCLTKNSDEAN